MFSLKPPKNNPRITDVETKIKSLMQYVFQNLNSFCFSFCNFITFIHSPQYLHFIACV